MFNGMNKKTRQAKEDDVMLDAQAPSAPAQTQSGLPLFFSNPVMVNPERHSNAGIRLNLAPEFAWATNSIPVNVVEFVEAAKYYPLAFTIGETVMPLAIVGLEQHNLFVGEDGSWLKDTYIPAYIRKHPFIFSESPGDDRLTLCVDEDSPYYVANAEGDNVARLFENGTPSVYTNNVLSFCTTFQEQCVLTRRFCDIIQELNLLEPNRSDIELSNGRKISLGGFQLIDQERFGKIPSAKLYELHQQGWLPLIYYMFLSSSNWRRLLDLAAARDAQA
jgi:hypothetical protein